MADSGGSGFLPHPASARRPSPSTTATPRLVERRRCGSRMCPLLSAVPALGSAAGSMVDAAGTQGHHLELLGQLERAARCLARRVLGLRRGRVAEEEPSPQLVVVALVRLDRLPVETRRRLVAGHLAELDELAVLHDGGPPPRELARGPPPHPRVAARPGPGERARLLCPPVAASRGE